MKVTITYRKSSSTNWPCVALAEVDGEIAAECGVGKTWEESRADLIKRLEERAGISTPPEPETIELPEAPEPEPSAEDIAKAKEDAAVEQGLNDEAFAQYDVDEKSAWGGIDQ